MLLWIFRRCYILIIVNLHCMEISVSFKFSNFQTFFVVLETVSPV